MNSPNEEQERMKERIANACIDALQRYPDMDSDTRQYIGEFLLCGTAGSVPYNVHNLHPYRWLIPLHPVEDRDPALNTGMWELYIRHYCDLSGYKETSHED